MDTKRVCGKCGADLVGVSAAQLCPGCLLECGLETEQASLSADHDGILVASPDSRDEGRENRQTEVPALRSFGDYELLEEIARGGMGIVYKARQVSLDRIVALKMLLFGPLTQPELVQRFRTEAAAAASLQHPNIVAIHEVGFCEGQHFFAMEYAAGRSLAEVVRDGPVPARRAVSYVKIIAEAIQYAHERGVLHRDLKPSNVLIDEFDQPKVTDFGLAKRLEKETELTLSGQVLGSPNYMPPEQAAPHRGLVGKRSDVYSLGAIMYHLLTGRAPFAAPTVAETLQQVHTAEPISLRILNPHLPRDLETICLKCLDKEPARRYATAQELADELGRFLDDKPILARPISRPEKAWRWCRRNPAVASLSASAAFILILGFAGVTWQWLRAERHSAERQKAATEAQVQRDVAQGRFYAAQMKLAHAAYRAGKLGAALEMLKAQKPMPGQSDFRGFDWRYLYRLCSSSRGEVIAANAGGFQSVDFSPDGRTVALGAGDGMVEIFDLKSRQRVECWQAHRGAVAGLAFRPRNANSMATVSGDDGLLKLWDIAGKRAVFTTNTLRGIYAFVKVAFSPSGKFLAANAPDGPSLNLWEVRSSSPDGEPTLVLRTTLPFSGPAAFSPDERTMAVCNEQPFQFKVALYRLSDGALVPVGIAHSEGIQSIAFSWDGSLLATGGGDERLVLWDLKRLGTKRIILGDFILVNSVVFAPDDQTIFWGGWNQNIYFWNLKAPAQPKLLAGHSAGVNALAVSPDGLLLASASQDGAARLWRLDRNGVTPTTQPWRSRRCGVARHAPAHASHIAT
jgi:serine/threonine protein kinase